MPPLLSVYRMNSTTCMFKTIIQHLKKEWNILKRSSHTTLSVLRSWNVLGHPGTTAFRRGVMRKTTATTITSTLRRAESLCLIHSDLNLLLCLPMFDDALLWLGRNITTFQFLNNYNWGLKKKRLVRPTIINQGSWNNNKAKGSIILV